MLVGNNLKKNIGAQEIYSLVVRRSYPWSVSNSVTIWLFFPTLLIVALEPPKLVGNALTGTVPSKQFFIL